MRTNSSTLALGTPARDARPSFLARAVLSRLELLERGSLTLHQGGRTHRFGNARQGEPEAALRVRDERFWAAVALRGSIGAGEAYSKGWWTSDEPTGVVRVLVLNRPVLAGFERGLGRLARPLMKAFHRLNRNTLSGSRENIAAHYDLSNDFFELFLDETMTYSCGIYERPESTLYEASVEKIDRLCRKLDLQPGDHLLEIGTGWGALAIHAAREYGCRVTTTTISAAQHAMARERVHAAGLEDRVTLLTKDYRELEGSFDKIVSVEMIEAVGHQYYDGFFARCASLLKEDGLMAMQAITIADQHYERAKGSVDFIQRYIFPGSCIPSVTALLDSATRASDLRMTHLEDIGLHYVPTLATWRRNLRERWDDALAQGLDEEFLRLFEFYFCYCEGGFAERHIGGVQVLLAKPGSRAAPPLAGVDA
jgi:cyclopropane-fatty-acyl-phospholipid synthase